MTRIGFLGDVHGDLGWTLSAHKSAIAAEASLLIQVGDFAVEWPGEHKHKMASKLERYAERSGVPIAFVRGNHDCVDSLFPLPVEPEGYARLREHILYIPDGSRFEWDGVSIGGLGGATSRDIAWRLEEEAGRKGKKRTLYWPQETISRRAMNRLITDGKLDVLVTHEAPVLKGDALPAALMPTLKQQANASLDRYLVSLADVGTGPRLLVHGHWHRRHSSHSLHGTQVEGLGREGDRLGALIVWDSETGGVENVEVEGGRRQG